MREIKIFLDEYNKAVSNSDIKRIAGHFHDKFTLSTPTDLWQLTNNDEFISNLTKSFQRYEKLGFQCCKMLATDMITLKSNHYIANIKWGLINVQNKPFIEFDITYCIKRINNEWKFIFVIDHNGPGSELT